MNLPENFIKRIHQNFPDEAGILLKSLEGNSGASIRINRKKAIFEDHKNQVPWCEIGYYLDRKPTYTFDPVYHSGAYYSQEASSMFIHHIVKNIVEKHTIETALDLCASPGGKSTLLLDVFDKNTLLVSNEVVPNRAEILKENIIKYGKSNVMVTNNSSETFGKLNAFFDLIVIDAPCSGEGMFRKDKNSINEWSEKNVEICTERQQRILANAMNCLKPNGIIIYSTCTFEPNENENQLDFLYKNYDIENIEIPVNNEWNIKKGNKKGIDYYYFLPGFTNGEGFYCCVFQKKNTQTVTSKKENIKYKKTALPDYISLAEDYISIEMNEEIIAFREIFIEKMLFLKKHLNVFHQGYHLIEINKNKHFLSPYVSWYNDIEITFPKIGLQLPEALNYLRRNTITTTENLQEYVQIHFDGFGIGTGKATQNRINNLYPKNWKINSPHNPENIILLENISKK